MGTKNMTTPALFVRKSGAALVGFEPAIRRFNSS